MSEPTAFQEFSFYLFVSVTLFFVLRLAKSPNRFLTFPVVSSAVWLVYVAPQAFGILYNPVHLPPLLYKYGFVPTMIMSALCILFGCLGWRLGGDSSHGNEAGSTHVGYYRLLVWGWIFTLLGWAAFIYIALQSGGLVGHYSVGGSYSLDWLGGEVIAVFFQLVLLNVGGAILAFCAFKRPRILSVLGLLLALGPSVADVIFLSRRSDFVYVIITLGAGAFFVRSWVPSRPTLLVTAVIGMFVVFAFPIIRGAFLVGAERNINFFEAFEVAIFEKVLGGGERKEFNNTIGIIGSTDATGDFGFGRNHWNLWVQTTVPRTLFGGDSKRALMFEGVGFEDVGMAAFDWRPHPFQSNSAAAGLFYDFGYFGSGFFLIIGYLFARVYRRCGQSDTYAMITYTCLLLLLPHWVSVGFLKAPRDLLFTFALLYLLRFGLSRRYILATARRSSAAF